MDVDLMARSLVISARRCVPSKTSLFRSCTFGTGGAYLASPSRLPHYKGLAYPLRTPCQKYKPHLHIPTSPVVPSTGRRPLQPTSYQYQWPDRQQEQLEGEAAAERARESRSSVDLPPPPPTRQMETR